MAMAWRWRGDDDAANCEGGDGVTMAMLPIAMVAMAWRWRGDGDDVAAKFELATAMAMAMPLRPTALRWR